MQVIIAPSNLGLRPLRPGHEPGAWRAPAALLDASPLEAIGSPAVVALPRPTYYPDPQAGTRIRNGRTMRDFNLALAAAVRAVRRQGEFALVVGGDCSILMGALAGARDEGPIALIHVDRHSDFRHPGNHDFDRDPGAAAGIDLALVTGRGEPLATERPGVAGPLVADADVVQPGGARGSRCRFCVARRERAGDDAYRCLRGAGDRGRWNHRAHRGHDGGEAAA